MFDKADRNRISVPLFQSVANVLAEEMARMNVEELARQLDCSRTGESSALWHTTLLAKSIPNKTVRMGGAGNGSRKDQGLHMKVDTTAIEQEIKGTTGFSG